MDMSSTKHGASRLLKDVFRGSKLAREFGLPTRGLGGVCNHFQPADSLGVDVNSSTGVGADLAPSIIGSRAALES